MTQFVIGLVVGSAMGVCFMALIYSNMNKK